MEKFLQIRRTFEQLQAGNRFFFSRYLAGISMTEAVCSAFEPSVS